MDVEGGSFVAVETEGIDDEGGFVVAIVGEAAVVAAACEDDFDFVAGVCVGQGDVGSVDGGGDVFFYGWGDADACRGSVIADGDFGDYDDAVDIGESVCGAATGHLAGGEGDAAGVGDADLV